MKKKILSILLCICLLSSVVMLFSSCGLGGSKKIELDGYSLVYAGDVSASLAAYVETTHAALQNKTGNSVKLVKLGTGKDSVSDYEILVGNTGRKETDKALKAVKGYGYTISVVKNKIVIVGTNNFFTLLALQKFNDTYLTGEVNAVLDIKKLVEKNMDTLVIEDTKWAFVHSALLADGDFVPKEIAKLKQSIGDMSDVRGGAMITIKDSNSHKNEILVGNTNRAESMAFTAAMDALDYGVGAQNGKIIIAGHSDAALQKAFLLFKDMLQDSVVKQDGKRVFVIPADFASIFVDKSDTVLTDFPRPDGLALSGSVDVHDGTEFYYEGEGVDANAYKAYCDKLVAEGYRLYGKEAVAEDSIYRTYVNEQADATLYVAYNAYKHAESQGLKNTFSPAIRIVSAKLGAVNLIDEQSYNFQSFEKKQNSSITAVELLPTYDNESGKDRYYGNLYIMTLEDGSFVIFDAGRPKNESRDEIYRTLLALYLEGHGNQYPTANDPIRIAAWVLSHGHGDHTGNFGSFVDRYCNFYGTGTPITNAGSVSHKPYVTIDRLIANFCSDEETYNSLNPNETIRKYYATYAAKVKDAPGEEPGFKYYKVHTGQKFWLANVEFEIIHTHEDIYPQKIHTYNNASTVIRTNMYYTENGTELKQSTKTSMLWLGDAQTQTSQSMRATYGSTIQSDMMQYAHHGFDGCEWKFYQLVAPKLVWWPQGKDEYKGYLDSKNKDNTTSAHGVNYQVSYNLKSVEYIILSVGCNYTLTIAGNGAVYSPYNATTNPYGVCHMAIGEPKSQNITLESVGKSFSYGYLKTKYYKG